MLCVLFLPSPHQRTRRLLAGSSTCSLPAYAAHTPPTAASWFLRIGYLSQHLQRNKSAGLAIQCEAQKGSPLDCSEVRSLPIILFVLLHNEIQSFPQLQHGSYLMLTRVCAEAGASEIADFPIAEYKFHFVCLPSPHHMILSLFSQCCSLVRVFVQSFDVEADRSETVIAGNHC